MSDDDPPAAGAAATSMKPNAMVVSLAPTAEPDHRVHPTEVPAI